MCHDRRNSFQLMSEFKPFLVWSLVKNQEKEKKVGDIITHNWSSQNKELE